AEEVLLSGGPLVETSASAVEKGVDGSLASEERIDTLGDGAALVRVEVALRPQDVGQRAIGQPALVPHRTVGLERRLTHEVLPEGPLDPGLEGARHLRSHLRSAGTSESRGIPLSS